MRGVQQLKEMRDWRERKDWESLLPEKRWRGEKGEEILFPLKTGARTPPPLACSLYSRSLSTPFLKRQLCSEGYIARVDPLFPLYLFFGGGHAF